MFPNPMDYLKTHAIAFAAGAFAVVACQLYGRLLSRKTHPAPS